jgi:hypothetical protein
VGSGKPKKDQPAVITRTQARNYQELADNDRRRGTPDDMIIAKSTEDFINRCIIVDDN